MTKHRCKAIPRFTQIEYDWQWKWCWTTPNVMEQIQCCPYCGTDLKEPTVTHIEMLKHLVNYKGDPLLLKDNMYAVIEVTNDAYRVASDVGEICVVPKNKRGILYKCKEVL